VHIHAISRYIHNSTFACGSIEKWLYIFIGHAKEKYDLYNTYIIFIDYKMYILELYTAVSQTTIRFLYTCIMLHSNLK